MSAQTPTPLKAIRAYCLWCMGGDESYRPYSLVRECRSTRCPLVPFREGKRAPGAGSPLKAIVAMCWDCMVGEATSARRGPHRYSRARPTRLTVQCRLSDCHLYRLRTGKGTSTRHRDLE